MAGKERIFNKYALYEREKERAWETAPYLGEKNKSVSARTPDMHKAKEAVAKLFMCDRETSDVQSDTCAKHSNTWWRDCSESAETYVSRVQETHAPSMSKYQMIEQDIIDQVSDSILKTSGSGVLCCNSASPRFSATSSKSRSYLLNKIDFITHNGLGQCACVRGQRVTSCHIYRHTSCTWCAHGHAQRTCNIHVPIVPKGRRRTKSNVF